MRIRNVKNKNEILDNSIFLVKNKEEYRGKWNELFENDNPIYLEIGMGKGKFLIEQAQKRPDINFIGIEKYDNIIVRALAKIPKELKNLKIVRANALEVDELFDKEISRIYLNFSDPWPKVRHHFRRLTSTIFLDKYDKIFKDEKCIHMKTDNKDLFAYSIEMFSNHDYYLHDVTFDLHKDSKEEIITTEYEEKFIKKGDPIYFLIASNVKKRKK